MGGVAKVLFSPLGHLIGAALKKPKMPEIPAPPPTVTRNAAMDAAMAEDALRRRKGGRANDLTGGGAEASGAGAKTQLGP
jgi:hypothetical protein